MSGAELCGICGVRADEHPKVPPGPPDPPGPRARHRFQPSGLTVPELIAERDAQIRLWRKRALEAERAIDAVRRALPDGAAPSTGAQP